MVLSNSYRLVAFSFCIPESSKCRKCAPFHKSQIWKNQMLSTMSAIDLCWHNWHLLALCCSCLAKATGKSKASGLADIPATDAKAQRIVKNNEKHVEESRTKGETYGINMHRQNKETFIVPTPFWNVCASTIYPFLFFHGFFILVSLAACDTCSLLCFRR